MQGFHSKLFIGALLLLSQSIFASDDDPFKNLECSYSEEIYTFHLPTTEDSGRVRVTEVWREDLINTLYDENLNLSESSNSKMDIIKIAYSTKTKAQEFNSGGTKIFSICEEGSQFFDSDLKTCSFNVPLNDDNSNSFRLEKEISDARYLSIIPINRLYETETRKLIFRFPKGMELDFKIFNDEEIEIKKKEGTFTSKDSKKYEEISFTIKDTKGAIFENHAPGFTYSQPHIVVITKSYQDEEGNSQKVFSSVDDQYEWYRTLIAMTDNQPDTLMDLVNDLTKGANSDFKKTEAIYYWIQDNIRYIAFERGIMGFKPDACQNVFSKKFGDCKGVANLAKNMLVLAGVDARLTWIGSSTISPQYDYSFPSLTTDNHMICTAIINNKRYFLDPTESMRALGENSSFIAGKPVLIEDGENYIIDKVPGATADLNQVFFEYKLQIEDGLLKGTSSRKYEGDHKVSMLAYFDRFSPKAWDEKVKAHMVNSDKNINILKTTYSDLADRTQDLTIDIDATWDNKIIRVDDKIIVTTDPHQTWFGFDLSDRESDYWLGKTYDHVFTYVLVIPNGYSVSSTPEDFKYETRDFLSEFKTEVKGNKILSSKRIIMKDRMVHESSFKEWEKARAELKKLYSTNIILQKK